MIEDINFIKQNTIPYLYRKLKTTTALEYFKANEDLQFNKAGDYIDSGYEPYLLIDVNTDYMVPIYDCGVRLVDGKVVLAWSGSDIHAPQDAILFWR
jgi:hypothetical protein